MLAVVTLPHGQVTTLAGEATLSRGLSHHRITLVARLSRALVAEHQAESSFRVQQLLMRLRVAARTLTTTPFPPLPQVVGFSESVCPSSYFPSALAFLRKLPVLVHIGLKRNALGGVFL